MNKKDEALGLISHVFPQHAATFLCDPGKELIPFMKDLQKAYPELNVSLYVGFQLEGPEGSYAHNVGVVGESGKGFSPFVDRELLGELPSSADPSLTNQIKDHHQYEDRTLHTADQARQEVAELLGEEPEVEFDAAREYLKHALEEAWWDEPTCLGEVDECEEEEQDEADTKVYVARGSRRFQ